MKIKQIFALCVALFAAIPAFSDDYPTISPTATYIDSSQKEQLLMIEKENKNDGQ